MANGFCARPVARRRPGRGHCRSPSTCRRSSSAVATSRRWSTGAARDRLAADRLELRSDEGALITTSPGGDDPTPAQALGVRHCDGRFRHRLFIAVLSASVPFDKIKIDQTFISNSNAIRNPPRSCAPSSDWRAGSICRLLRGRETHDQLAFLTREACDEVQGYFIAGLARSNLCRRDRPPGSAEAARGDRQLNPRRPGPRHPPSTCWPPLM